MSAGEEGKPPRLDQEVARTVWSELSHARAASEREAKGYRDKADSLRKTVAELDGFADHHRRMAEAYDRTMRWVEDVSGLIRDPDGGLHS